MELTFEQKFKLAKYYPSKSLSNDIYICMDMIYHLANRDLFRFANSLTDFNYNLLKIQNSNKLNFLYLVINISNKSFNRSSFYFYLLDMYGGQAYPLPSPPLTHQL